VSATRGACHDSRVKILIVEDEDAIAVPLAEGLRREGFEVERVATGGEALEAPEPDLVLLDLRLPDVDGLAVCRELRARSEVPIIVVTAKGEEVDRVVGLEVGADDYVVKPFSLAELVSRVRALLRRRDLDRLGTHTLVSAGDLRIDLVRHEASIDGRRVPLTPAEMRLLTKLAADPERAFTRDELMEALWDADVPGSSRACDTHVLNLRRKLDGSGVAIETVRGYGYRLRA
jgi:two-component system, OmpR family, response regulator RegX3